ncbi:MAG: glucuronate isomerase [Bacteroidota bacterium]
MNSIPSRITNSFITEDFLLQNSFARKLYHDYASKMPIIDYHCHLSPHDIAVNRQFENLGAVWLAGDHYKWRAMRALGVNEKFITGNGSHEEKFEQWAYTVPYTMRNPLYHWTHLELKRYFGFEELLKPETAKEIYSNAGEILKRDDFKTRGLLKMMNVETVCTTDDPTDSLEYHKQVAKEGYKVKMLPAFRPDKSFAIEDPIAYKVYLEKLAPGIKSYDDLLTALEKKIDYFHECGGRLSDHGLESLYFEDGNPGQIFKAVLSGTKVSAQERAAFKTHILTALCKMYHKRGWVQQFHLGAIRNTNQRMLRELGPDTGFDSIGDYSHATALAHFFNNLDNTNQLAKTVLYNLNPSQNEVFATMTGNFNDGSVKGKIQFGSAWWFLDQKDGMEKQINTLSNMGLLSCFIGMLTDSRSFLSFPRHEYFRRILCNLIGKDVENGELPDDEKWLGKIVSDVCYNNAKEYFNL